jgi:hypothetical protein
MVIFGIVLAVTWYIILSLWIIQADRRNWWTFCDYENGGIRLPKNNRNDSMDLHDRALPKLREQAATNPRLAALLDEVERGRKRQQQRGMTND